MNGRGLVELRMRQLSYIREANKAIQTVIDDTGVFDQLEVTIGILTRTISNELDEVNALTNKWCNEIWGKLKEKRNDAPDCLHATAEKTIILQVANEIRNLQTAVGELSEGDPIRASVQSACRTLAPINAALADAVQESRWKACGTGVVPVKSECPVCARVTRSNSQGQQEGGQRRDRSRIINRPPQSKVRKILDATRQWAETQGGFQQRQIE